uniref:Ubiquinone/menaquinone biosynthesis C-methylase UbiE n=1 Tax=Candidatus Kentrum sp. SD TaxID=2126332 RepID=A0A450YDI6_9GAMM|nr:MAG: Ubiquinone/menaquinone biosynthesis C-methylase UbiE [Candidatus Kentron sp. SD]VFK39607.1 MAG: Ubiquinone/menaquinone biosynthesis C-methylase UbiE [Candidatus Kentron sp. SD]VFK78073.1 MAG: Ubiquinone/menaquinone biosynthesis C-methylase UbiE [Candidatus Kentron sp. SD]
MDNNAIVDPIVDMNRKNATSAYASSAYKDIDTLHTSEQIPIPNYLQDVYWWAYLHPNAVRFFERQWIVNLILWGNSASLRDAAIKEMGVPIQGHNLQIACVYGNFSQQVAMRLAPDSCFDIVDVAPVQLENTRAKVKGYPNVALHHQDSTNLHFQDASYDNVVVFFLLHEQPAEVRARTIREALRVVKPEGKVIFVDYHRPHWGNPFRYLMVPILATLEPFALDLWKNEIVDWIPKEQRPAKIHKETFFSGLYQKVVMTF